MRIIVDLEGCRGEAPLLSEREVRWMDGWRREEKRSVGKGKRRDTFRRIASSMGV